MQWLTQIVGGKKFLTWVIAFVAVLFGKVSPDLFHTLTMGYLVLEGVQGGITKESPVPLNKFWNLLGGRKMTAFIATSALVLLKGYPETMWLEVAGAYGLGVVGEEVTYRVASKISTPIFKV